MILKICPAEAGKKELKFKLKIVEDAIVLLPLLKCTLSVSQEGSNYDKFNEASMSPIIEKTERQEREEFEKTLDYYTHNNLEEVWSKVRKVFYDCKDDCKREGILIALKVIEEKMTELELEIFGKKLTRRL